MVVLLFIMLMVCFVLRFEVNGDIWMGYFFCNVRFIVIMYYFDIFINFRMYLFFFIVL